MTDREADNTLNVGVGKYRIQANGIVVILLLVAAGIVGVVMWGLNRNETLIRDDHRRIIETVGEQTEEMRVQTYILSLPPEKRPRLVIPKSLRNRMYDSP